jgi:hypothetical protein
VSLSTTSGDFEQVEIPRGAGSQLIAVDVCSWPITTFSPRCGIWSLSGQYRTLARQTLKIYGFTA